MKTGNLIGNGKRICITASSGANLRILAAHNMRAFGQDSTRTVLLPLLAISCLIVQSVLYMAPLNRDGKYSLQTDQNHEAGDAAKPEPFVSGIKS